ncbi:Arm DNA-binding domain-containing protein [Kingella kingae]|uniref:Arm DNA-binding domain-containing protein n=1 Tax=Kingella kingae TaxID=504 RepID=UPI0032B3F7FD
MNRRTRTLFVHHVHRGKLWRLKYRIHGKEKTLSIGAYPDVTLAQAREQAAIARQKHEKTKPKPPHIIPL